MRLRSAIVLVTAVLTLSGCAAFHNLVFHRDGYAGTRISANTYRATYATRAGSSETSAAESFLYWNARLTVDRGDRYFAVAAQEVSFDRNEGIPSPVRSSAPLAAPIPAAAPRSGAVGTAGYSAGDALASYPVYPRESSQYRRENPGSAGAIYRVNAVVRTFNERPAGVQVFDALEVLSRLAPQA